MNEKKLEKNIQKFVSNEIKFTFALPNQKWPVRLTVRTSGFHPGNRGSIPLRAT